MRNANQTSHKTGPQLRRTCGRFRSLIRLNFHNITLSLSSSFIVSVTTGCVGGSKELFVFSGKKITFFYSCIIGLWTTASFLCPEKATTAKMCFVGETTTQPLTGDKTRGTAGVFLRKTMAMMTKFFFACFRLIYLFLGCCFDDDSIFSVTCSYYLGGK